MLKKMVYCKLLPVGGRDGISNLNFVKFYSPITNTWSILEESMHVAQYFAGVVATDMQISS